MTDVNDVLGHAGIAAGLAGVLWKLGARLMTLLETKWNAEIDMKRNASTADIEQRSATAKTLNQVVLLLAHQADQNDQIVTELKGLNSIDLPRRTSAPPERKS